MNNDFTCEICGSTDVVYRLVNENSKYYCKDHVPIPDKMITLQQITKCNSCETPGLYVWYDARQQKNIFFCKEHVPIPVQSTKDELERFKLWVNMFMSDYNNLYPKCVFCNRSSIAAHDENCLLQDLLKLVE